MRRRRRAGTAANGAGTATPASSASWAVAMRPPNSGSRPRRISSAKSPSCGAPGERVPLSDLPGRLAALGAADGRAARHDRRAHGAEPSVRPRAGHARSAADGAAAVIGLDELLAKPELARTLSKDEATQLHLQALAVAAACVMAVVNTPRFGEDRTLSTKEAAAMLGVSTSTLRHNASTTYASLRVENGTKRLTFSSLAIARFLKR